MFIRKEIIIIAVVVIIVIIITINLNVTVKNPSNVLSILSL